MDIIDLAFVESHCVKMMFYPEAWDSSNTHHLDWEKLDFPPSKKSLVPRESGVYAFIVEPNLFSLKPANGLFYIGKATNLYNRISEYTGQLKKDFSDSQRPHIWKMVNQWNGRLKYYYTTTDVVATAEQLEEEMLKALRPPFNRQYDAETSQVMRAF
ncbi:hypothetical protein IDSA_06685 [Pseudidiomarina salinarum]|uniref:GIY-YIG domain-containing protein n=1 Tax=Pseudidiomarina salinarum TaxID=435908 RepID=A0A094IY92_9GAMM|nr:GIY-YIG nuclease family protein [Pseudidiomarina salinarum]KFZ30774.1 hypothetical protein IDSA_06685 [Pseudidiomarina salinarum]RUO71239.1 hypothetical protein CWI79_07370 [Pseudidiomarina salinarum]